MVRQQPCMLVPNPLLVSRSTRKGIFSPLVTSKKSIYGWKMCGIMAFPMELPKGLRVFLSLHSQGSDDNNRGRRREELRE
ncbi:hypothetical protein WN55_07753 [Dufourea novaeangliae]|uniref:Uncharacterized protein n=1 Tax=Dufourea novaeangliae TaxID=178035 RepID=A0A154PSL6_DUFNO|nr:hypothetical protein WN55_07753 [Dufourea novaeangliae]